MMDTPATPTAGWLPGCPLGPRRLSRGSLLRNTLLLRSVWATYSAAQTQPQCRWHPPGPAQPPSLCGCPSISAPVCSSGLQSSAHLPRATRGPRLLPPKHPANPSMTSTSSGIRLSEESVKGNGRLQGSLGTRHVGCGPGQPHRPSPACLAALVSVTSSGGAACCPIPGVPATSLLPVFFLVSAHVHLLSQVSGFPPSRTGLPAPGGWCIPVIHDCIPNPHNLTWPRQPCSPHS